MHLNKLHFGEQYFVSTNMRHVLHTSKNSLKLKPSAKYARPLKVIKILFFRSIPEVNIICTLDRKEMGKGSASFS
jgi:hypothetical protein